MRMMSIVPKCRSPKILRSAVLDAGRPRELPDPARAAAARQSLAYRSKPRCCAKPMSRMKRTPGRGPQCSHPNAVDVSLERRALKPLLERPTHWQEEPLHRSANDWTLGERNSSRRFRE